MNMLIWSSKKDDRRYKLFDILSYSFKYPGLFQNYIYNYIFVDTIKVCANQC